MTDGQYPAWLEWDPDKQEWVTYQPVLNRPAPGPARPATPDPAEAPPPVEAPRPDATHTYKRPGGANTSARERKQHQ